ncbi:MAG: uroporphyrinogen-III C-methyltransferase [Gammaproteobacteria bacterium]|nr:uroporphyrinogen-III C-methyltransferase [Gammaproteobacteria bacterium]
MRHLPVFLDLKSAPALVAGGGRVAARKVALLRSAGAAVTVVAPTACPEIASQAARGELAWRPRSFEPGDVAGTRVVFAATDDESVNDAVAVAARAAGVPVNVADDGARSSFILPAIVDRSPLLVAVSSGGAAPMLATAVRARIEALLDHSWSRLAEFADRWRQAIRAARPGIAARRRLYEWLLDGPVAGAVRAGREPEADKLFAAALAEEAPAPRGFVSLVGAGPGDPDLLTLKALRALGTADVILADRLVGPEILARARREAEVVDVGKSAGGAGESQERINRLLVHHARRGRRVVRLKGGDPLVFGRGGEEAAWLARHGVRFEIVPGITAALGCAAYAGIPLTDRRYAETLHFVTAHGADAADRIDWQRLAGRRQTLVVYMGVAAAASVRERLIEARLPPATPVAIVENGTLPGQRVLLSDLAGLGSAIAAEGIRSPALLIIGESAAEAARLAWFGPPPAVEAVRKSA